MFDDLKQDSGQSISTPQQGVKPSTDTPTQATPAAKPASVSDMFGDVDPLAAGHGPVSLGKPSAIQSGKIKPVSQTSVPSGIAVPEATNNQITSNMPTANHMMVTDKRSSGIMRKILIAVLVIFLLAAVGAGIYYLFLRNEAVLVESSDNQNTNEAIVDENINEAINVPIIDEDSLDDDFDGLSNGLEKTYGTNPLEADSDNDGVFDQDEVEIYLTDPLSDDSDNDGLSDHEEIIIYKTDPNDPDTDGDTFLDGAEVANGYNPLGNGKLEEVLDEDNINTNESI